LLSFAYFRERGTVGTYEDFVSVSVGTWWAHGARTCPAENNAALAAHLEAFVHLLLLEVAKHSVGVHLSQRVSLGN